MTKHDIQQSDVENLQLNEEEILLERRLRNGFEHTGEAVPIAGNNKLSKAFYKATGVAAHGFLYSAPLGMATAILGTAISYVNYDLGANIAKAGLVTGATGLASIGCALALSGIALVIDKYGAEDLDTIKKSYLERAMDELENEATSPNSPSDNTVRNTDLTKDQPSSTGPTTKLANPARPSFA